MALQRGRTRDKILHVSLFVYLRLQALIGLVRHLTRYWSAGYMWVAVVIFRDVCKLPFATTVRKKKLEACSHACSVMAAFAFIIYLVNCF